MHLASHLSPLASHLSPLDFHLSSHPSPLTLTSSFHLQPLTAHPSPLTPHLQPLTSNLSPLTPSPQGFPTLASFVVVAVNLAISTLVGVLGKFERHPTLSAMHKAKATTIFISQASASHSSLTHDISP